jgi:putative membrane protein
MKSILINWFIGTITILLTAYILPGIRIDKLSSAIWAAAVLGILNAFIKPILVFLTLPITILTLGLFLLIINAAILMLVSQIISGFRIDSFWTALLASVIISIITFLTHRIV